jgi:4-hydroxy-tetrahydrodipicolinate synthase
LSATKRERFGLSCALTTPIDAHGEPDLAGFARHARWTLENGCQTVTAFGTTGEGAALSLPQRATMLGALRGIGIEGHQINFGVAASAMGEALDQARMGIEHGCRYQMVCPPFYFKGVSDEGLYVWFSRFIEALGPDCLPIILYHIPSVTAVSLSSDLVGRLKKAFPGVIAGVKDSSGDWPTTERFLKDHASDLAILVGDERLLARAVREGGEGSICGVANLVPGWLRPMVDKGVEDLRVNAIVDLICGFPVVPAVKALVGKMNNDAGFGAMLPPLEALSEADRAKLFAGFDRAMESKAA